jgi:Protein of unknown function (DUF3306)
METAKKMSETKDFLSRWSRRKRALEESGREPPDQSAPETSTPPESSAEKLEQNKAAEFDLSALPSLDSITSGTDVSAFLQKGVPLDLTRAALRRAWSADPAIRDFIGLAENAWDFNDPNAMHGFGLLDQTPEEVQQMLAQLFNDVCRTAEPNIQSEDKAPGPEIASGPSRGEPANTVLPSGEEQSAEGDRLGSLQEHDTESSNIAAQHPRPDHEPAGPMRRAHGGALPK